MIYAGIDLHKQSITVCVMDHSRNVLHCKSLFCQDEQAIVAFFENLTPFRAVLEATASYEWFVRLIEPLADKVVLAHPQKLRVIAESTRKSDELDAETLATFLALDIIPESYRPTPRQRDHRCLVRQRDAIQRRITSIKNRMRRIMSDYNADRKDLFTKKGRDFLEKYPLSRADRFTITQLVEQLELLRKQLREAEQELKSFANSALIREKHARELLQTVPGVGFVTTEVVLAELADIDRFRTAKQVVAYAGLAPGRRESAGKSKELHIEKTGSRHLRWILVEAAWQLVRYAPRWKAVYERLKKRLKAKKAIVTVARRLLTMLFAILKTGEPYSATHAVTG